VHSIAAVCPPLPYGTRVIEAPTGSRICTTLPGASPRFCVSTVWDGGKLKASARSHLHQRHASETFRCAFALASMLDHQCVACGTS